MINMKKYLTILVLLLIQLIVLTGCTQEKEETVPQEEEKVIEIRNYPIEHEMEFGGIYIQIDIDDFNKLGFSYGDSVNVEFDNGYKLKDIPYYNGYYVDAGKPLLVGYPGYQYIKVTENYGQDLWDEFSLQIGSSINTLWLKSKVQEHNKATVVLNEKGKYLDIQEASDIHYYDERERYDSDVMFANFRSMNVGKLKKDIIYRSASPCDNQHNRASYVDKLIKEAGVKTILDLADNEIRIEKYLANDDFASDYFKTLYDNGNVVAIALNMNFYSEDFGIKLVQGFQMMMEKEGPYLIHCTEGKDRTGFVAMLIEALAGASYEEIVNDYMLTYYNYYRIDQNNEKEKYDTILEKNLNAMIKSIVNDDSIDYKNCDLSVYAENYLLKMGMSKEELNKFKNCLID